MERFTITREGFPFIFPPLVIALIAFVFKWWIAGSLLAGLTFFLIWFFRKPHRIIVQDSSVILSPADGTVVELEDARDDGTRHIHIFMSVFNVHINVSPVSGLIRDITYTPGKKRPASGQDVSRVNENNLVEMEHERGILSFRQIAGILARRIVFYPRRGDRLAQGEKVGMIKFGSRVEVYLPGNTQILVQKGDKVHAGKTKLALWT